MQYHSQIIETAPMQIYSSAVLFSPTESLVRSNFIGKLSSWITSTPAKDSHWSPCLQVIEANNPVAVNSRDMNLLILSHNVEDVEIWDIALGQRTRVLSHTEIVCDAVFTSDPKHVLTVTSSQLIFWDISSGTLMRSINIIGLHVIPWGCKISKDGKFLVTYLGDDNSIQIYNTVEATKIQATLLPPEFPRDIEWSNDSKLLYIGCSTFSVLWDLAGDIPKMKFNREYSELPTRLSFSEDSKLIALINPVSKGIVIWDSSRDEKVSMIIPDYDPKEIIFIQFSKDSTLLAVSKGSFVEVRDIDTGQRLHNLNFGTRFIMKLTWSADSKALVVIFRDSVEIYDLTESRILGFHDS
jgi:WD40 repeat protein